MSDCSKCRFCEEEYEYDDEIQEEYLVRICTMGYGTDIDFDCRYFEKYEPTKQKEEYTKCDKCEYLEECMKQSEVIDCTTIGDAQQHYICSAVGCIKNKANK